MASSKRYFLFEKNIDAVMGFIDVDMLKNDEKMSSEIDFAFKNITSAKIPAKVCSKTSQSQSRLSTHKK